MVRIHQRRLIRFSAWLESRQIDLAAVRSASAEEFLTAQQAVGRFTNWRVGGWDALLQYLREAGVPVTDPAPAPQSPTEDLLDRFADYQATERGLSARTIDRDRQAVEPFVAAMPSELGNLAAAEITAYVVQQAEQRPRADVREVFLCAYAPYRPMSRNAVTSIVARAARRAGLGVMHAHRLRHSAATYLKVRRPVVEATPARSGATVMLDSTAIVLIFGFSAHLVRLS